MLKSNAPLQFVLPFAGDESSAYRNVIPIPSQSGITPGAASFTDGFPPVTMESIASGGVPPYGPDMNGILYDATLAAQWQQAGFVYPYNSAFATNANVGGYPAGALLGAASGACLWFNTVDSNTSNPDTSSGANWISFLPNAGAVPVSTTGGSTTLTANQLTSHLISVTGALTSNATIVLPLRAGAQYVIQNGTTGAYTLIVQSSSGAGVAIPQGANMPQGIVCDGTNWYSEGLSGGPYLPLSGTAVAATKLATARNFSISGFATAAAVSFDGTGNVVFDVTALNVAAALGYTPANDASVVHLAGAETIIGDKTFTGRSSSSGVNAGWYFLNRDNAGVNSVWYAQGGTLNLFTSPLNSGAGGSVCAINQTSGAWNFPFAISGVNASFSGAVSAASYGAVNATTGTFSGAVTTGALTCTTFNASSSDRRLKRNIRKFKARPLHRSVPLVSYTLKSNGWQGLGSIAQGVKKTAPEHVGEFEQDGKKYLSLNYAGMAYEQAIWAGHEIDRLAKRIEKLERSRLPRKPGFLRRLREIVW